MIKKKKFDEIIRKNIEQIEGDEVIGYLSEETGGNKYENYYSEAEFKKFKDTMEKEYPKIFKKYGKEGKGGEMDVHSGKPPKMASVASSARFCYLAFRKHSKGLLDKSNIEFEYGCSIKDVKGTAPQLDAFIPSINTYIEVKCHEIFDSHKINLSKQYKKWIEESFEISQYKINKGGVIEIPLSVFGIKEASSMFDIKQFLCHLMGIASRKDTEKEATLVYLFFKPIASTNSDTKEIETLFGELEREIKTIFNSAPIQKFVRKHNIHLKAVAQHSKIMQTICATENNGEGNATIVLYEKEK